MNVLKEKKISKNWKVQIIKDSNQFFGIRIMDFKNQLKCEKIFNSDKDKFYENSKNISKINYDYMNSVKEIKIIINYFNLRSYSFNTIIYHKEKKDLREMKEFSWSLLPFWIRISNSFRGLSLTINKNCKILSEMTNSFKKLGIKIHKNENWNGFKEVIKQVDFLKASIDCFFTKLSLINMKILNFDIESFLQQFEYMNIKVKNIKEAMINFIEKRCK